MSKKKGVESKNNFEIKFWKDWLYADHLKRLDLVKKLPLFKMCLEMENKKMWRKSFATLLNSYFEDLESAVYTKIRLEEKEK